MLVATSIAFRADASLAIGTGHVMRCLALADALTQQGAQCHFICRVEDSEPEHVIRRRGHHFHRLPAAHNSIKAVPEQPVPDPQQLQWLAVTQGTDAEETARILSAVKPDWLIVDHYGIDAAWERALVSLVPRLLAIDDLANRPHACNILLDQTLGRDPADYAALVPAGTSLLCGPQYALLRSTFANRRAAMTRRAVPDRIEQILVSMGGVDAANLTAHVIAGLEQAALPAGCKITVVLGGQSPWLDDIRGAVRNSPLEIHVLTDVDDMARLMASSDLAIGAGGSTSWERCCLGLPSLIVIAADNQRLAAASLSDAGAAKVVPTGPGLQQRLAVAVDQLLLPAVRRTMADRASRLVDGLGTARVADVMRRANGTRTSAA